MKLRKKAVAFIESTLETLAPSTEDTARIHRVRSNAEGAAIVKELLNTANIRPGCIIRLLESAHLEESKFCVFMGLHSPYEGWLGKRNNPQAFTR